jgi:3-deoxy-D-manno-octulosonic-acid transferase
MIHAVSLGEINATRGLVQVLSARRPDAVFILSVTTETGYARGRELYGSDPKVTLIRYPLDFTSAVRRTLDAFSPAVVVLMELEVWPNFIRHCHRRGIPVLLVNGRLTTYSFKNYRKLRALLAPTFRRLTAVCAQDQTFADRFVALGTPADRVSVTGTMKFDTAQIADHIQGQDELAASLGLAGGAGTEPGTDPIWVCGSTGPGEEEMLLRGYRRLLPAYPRLRLVIVPRHPERFDAVAAMIRDRGFNLVRRSENRSNAPAPAPPCALEPPKPGDALPVILGDTMGELRKFYGLATVVFVGRSLVDLGPRQHGSDMIEPAALAKPVVVGPWTHNFADAMSRFSDAGAVKIVGSEAEMIEAIDTMLTNPAGAAAMAARARAVVRAQQGATDRHVELILRHLPASQAQRTR